MNSSWWPWKCTPDTEVDFRNLLRHLKSTEASNQVIAAAVAADPFLLGMVKAEAAGLKLGWPPLMMDALRNETLRLVWRDCASGGLLKCDPERKDALGLWRLVVKRKVRTARDRVRRDCQFKLRYGKSGTGSLVTTVGDKTEILEAKACRLDPTELQFALRIAINGLEKPRLREVLQMLLAEYTQQEMARALKLSVDQVRRAIQAGKAALRQKLHGWKEAS